MSQEDFATIYQDLVSIYHEGMAKQDAPLLNTFVNDDRILLFKNEESREAYTDLRLWRAKCFILFGHYTKAIKECRLTLAFAHKKRHGDVYLLWCQVLYSEFVLSADNAILKSLAEQTIALCERGVQALVSSKDGAYQRLSFVNVAAFFYLYLGKRTEAKALYKEMKFIPIPIVTYNDEHALEGLFLNYAKGLAVAIELQDETLLRQLLKVISIDDQTLYGEKNLFKLFHATLVTTMDTHPNFSTAFNQLFQIQNQLKSTMKELDFFLTSIHSNMQQALDVFFKGFK